MGQTEHFVAHRLEHIAQAVGEGELAAEPVETAQLGDLGAGALGQEAVLESRGCLGSHRLRQPCFGRVKAAQRGAVKADQPQGHLVGYERNFEGGCLPCFLEEFLLGRGEVGRRKGTADGLPCAEGLLGRRVFGR